MDQIILYIIIGIIVAAGLGVAIYKGIQIAKMSPDDRRKVLVTYLVGLVNLAEGEIGSGHGAEKLAQVEKWFIEKAPLTYKLILKTLGSETLVELIEIALRAVKENFGK